MEKICVYKNIQEVNVEAAGGGFAEEKRVEECSLVSVSSHLRGHL